MSEHPWMEHDQTGHRAQLPDDPYWRANGWNPVDGPHPEPDMLHDPAIHDVPAEPEPEEAKSKPAKSAGKPAAKPTESEEK